MTCLNTLQCDETIHNNQSALNILSISITVSAAGPVRPSQDPRQDPCRVLKTLPRPLPPCKAPVGGQRPVNRRLRPLIAAILFWLCSYKSDPRLSFSHLLVSLFPRFPFYNLLVSLPNIFIFSLYSFLYISFSHFLTIFSNYLFPFHHFFSYSYSISQFEHVRLLDVPTHPDRISLFHQDEARTILHGGRR